MSQAKGKSVSTTSGVFAWVASVAICMTAAAGSEGYVDNPHYRHAATEARLLPLQPVGNRTIMIDGKLEDWGDMRQDSFVIHQLLDHTLPDFRPSWKAQWETEPLDAALIKLAYDKDSLYVVIQVADDSVFSPATNRLGGDVVDMYLDLRPLTGKGPSLGHVKYTEGVYHIVFGPPCGDLPVHAEQPESEMFTDWKPNQKVPRMGPFDVKGSVFQGGYTIELRIPLSSFPHKPTADRLAQPIGFEVMIEDQDAERTEGRPERLYYSCSGYSGGKDYYKCPSPFACTDPELRTALPLSRLRANPLKQAPGGDECEGWIVTDAGEKDLAGAFLTASQAVPGYTVPAVKPAWPNDSFTTYSCQALGLAFHHRRVMTRLPARVPADVGNRYHAVYPLDGNKPKIDGKLDDWADYEETAMGIYEYGHQPYCVGIEDRRDVARHKLMTDGDTLYIAIRVKDDSVINPVGWRHMQGGDCVFLYLDVRSPEDKKYPMSHAEYKGDVHRFCMVPPMENMIHWKAQIAKGEMSLDEVTNVDYASVRTEDGYVIELAVPLSAVQAKPISGRFMQPFGFELLYSDIDKRGEDGLAPMIYYSWGGSQEQNIKKSPNQFSLADHLPNRLPEVRQLVDNTAVEITVDPVRKLQAFSGFGGNYQRDGQFLPDGGSASSFGLDAANTLHIARNMKYKWARVNLHLFDWEWINDDNDPNTTDYEERFRSRWGDPAVPFDKQREGLHFKGVVDRYLHIMKKWLPEGTRVIAYADTFPAWLMEGSRIKKGMESEFVECVTSYMVYAKEKGIEFDLFAFNNPYKGYPGFDQEEYPKMLAAVGKSFARNGLKTKLMLCDTKEFYTLRNYAKLANDMELRRYLGGVGFQLSGAIDGQMHGYRLWSDLAEHMGLPFIATTYGRSFGTSPTYLFEEVRTQQQLVQDLKVNAALLSNFIANTRSLKDNLTFAQRVFPAPDHARAAPSWQYNSRYRQGVPILDLAPWTYEEDDVLTGLRYMFTRQFCELTPEGYVFDTQSSHPHVMVSGFHGKTGELTLHISNAGPTRKADISGLPAGIKSLNAVRSGSGDGYHWAGPVILAGGKTKIELPAWSLVTLTTLPKQD